MKILVMKFRRIGDVLLTTPLLENLRHFYPDAQIHFALNRSTEEMITQNPNVAKIHIYEREKIKNANIFARIWGEIKFALELRREKFDIIIQTTEGDRGLILAILSGAKEIIAYPTRHAYLNKFITKSLKHSKEKHTVEQNLDVLRVLGFEPISKKVSIYFDDFSSKFRDLPENFIHIHLMSVLFFKCLSDELAAKIIDFCEIDLGIKVVITGDKNEAEMQKNEQILSFCKSNPIKFLGNLNLKEVAFLNSKARLFIGVDTSIMHISAANNTPVIAFFGPTGTLCWGAWDNDLQKNNYLDKGGVQNNGKHTIIQDDKSCIPCKHKGCDNSKTSKCLIELNFEQICKIIKLRVDELDLKGYKCEF
ncbi:MAG: putative lipopolysaccharide heptosyltransferase III [Campylobacter sp.]|nr:putative lipopolysaccharide heptosyltransferase III [Campylobacter sp.]